MRINKPQRRVGMTNFPIQVRMSTSLRSFVNMDEAKIATKAERSFTQGGTSEIVNFDIEIAKKSSVVPVHAAAND